MRNTDSIVSDETPDDDAGESAIEATSNEKEAASDACSSDGVSVEGLEKMKRTRTRKPKPHGQANTLGSVESPIGSRSRHLTKLKLVGRAMALAIAVLNACQNVGRELDRDKVKLYREMLEIMKPPHIVVIRDVNGKYHIASGHHRVAAALLAGQLEVICDVYEGSIEDALVVGGEENQGPAPMNLKARKSMLDTILSLNGNEKYTQEEMGVMTGLERHTIAKHIEKRKSGDFIEVAGRVKRDKSPEEQLYDAAKNLIKNVQKHGPDVMVKALGLMQPHLREEVLRRILPDNEA